MTEEVFSGEQMARESFMALWQSYCDQKMEIEQLRGNLSLAEEGLANYAQENGRMNAALKLIANDSCDKFTTGPGSCWNHPELTPEAGHTADRWCIPCIALSALVPNQIRALPQPREHGA